MSLTSIVSALAACFLLIRAARAQDFAYVTDETDNALIILDATTGASVGTVPLGVGYGGGPIAFSSDGTRAYAVDDSSGTVTVLDTINQRLLEKFTVGRNPGDIGLSLDDRFLYVSGEPITLIDLATGRIATLADNPIGFGSVAIARDGQRAYVTVGNWIDVFDTSTNIMIDTMMLDFLVGSLAVTLDDQYLVAAGFNSDGGVLRIYNRGDAERAIDIPVSEPVGEVALSPDGTMIFAVLHESGDVLQIVMASQEIIGKLDHCGRMRGIALNHDGRLAYATGYRSTLTRSRVCMMDTTTGHIRGIIDPYTGFGYRLAVAPGTGDVYMSSFGSLVVVSAAAEQVLKRYRGANNPRGLALLPDRSEVYIANPGASMVSVFDTRSGRLLELLTGGHPFRVAITPDGKFAYVTDSQIAGSIFIIDTTTKRVVKRITVPEDASGIAMSPDGTRVFVSSVFGASIAVVDTVTQDLVATISLPDRPTNLGVSFDGNTMFVPLQFENTILGIDSHSYVIRDRIDIDDPSSIYAQEPCGIVAASDGTAVYVTGSNVSLGVDYNVLAAIDPLRSQLAWHLGVSIPYEAGACGLALSDDNSRLYIADFGNAQITLIDTSQRSIIARWPLQGAPFDVALANAPSEPLTEVVPPRPTAISEAGRAQVNVGRAVVRAGMKASIPVDFVDDSANTMELELSISFDESRIHFLLDSCDVAPDLQKSFARTISGTEEPHILRMSLQSPGLIVTESGRPLEPDVPIRDGTLISCAFRAVGNAPPGTYALHAADAVVVDQNGNRWPAATSDGAITIEAGPLIACAGDCDGDGGVSVDELVKAVRVVLLDEPVGFCASVDRDDDTVVTVDDLIAGVLNALRGCNFE